MRTIKFRAWSKKDECWCGAFSVHKSGLFTEMSGARMENGVCVAYSEWKDLNEQDEIVLMQFTGLLDKNGKEIYEGDVVRVDLRDEGKDSGWIQEVQFDSVGGIFTTEEVGDILIPLGDKDLFLEVIGNRFENPELLNPNPLNKQMKKVKVEKACDNVYCPNEGSVHFHQSPQQEKHPKVEKKPHEVCPKDSNGKCVAKIIDLAQPQKVEKCECKSRRGCLKYNCWACGKVACTFCMKDHFVIVDGRSLCKKSHTQEVLAHLPKGECPGLIEAYEDGCVPHPMTEGEKELASGLDDLFSESENSNPQPKEPQQESWSEYFQSRWYPRLAFPEVDMDKILEDIRQEKERAYEAGRDFEKEVQKGLDFHELAQAKELGRREERERLRKMVEGMKGDADTKLTDVIIYNTALEDVLTQLLGEMEK